jgi:hypothetical protein
MQQPSQDRSELATRLRRLPGQLLLALINGTAMLVIVAGVVLVIALGRIERFAENVAGTMTSAVLSKVDLPSRDALSNIRELSAEVRALHSALRDIKAGETTLPGIARLNERLDEVSRNIDRIGNARSVLTDAVAARFGDAATRMVTTLRDCDIRPRQTAAPLQLK